MPCYACAIDECRGQISSGFSASRTGLGMFWGGRALVLVWGRAISEFGHEDRFLAEFEGIGFAVVCGGLGVVAKGAGERLVDSNDEAMHSSEE